MNKPALKSALCTGRSLICELVLKMLEISIFRNNNKQYDINEMLFYGAEHEEHTRQIGLNKLLCIYYIILHANRTVDVCVPSLASDTMAKCLVNVHQKNKVNVRIVIHSSDDFHNLQLFAQNGIEVKVIRAGVRLEHEFVLVDAGAGSGAVAALGALDRDTARLRLTRDATLLTSDTALLTALNSEFQRVWNSVSDLTSAKDDKTDSLQNTYSNDC